MSLFGPVLTRELAGIPCIRAAFGLAPPIFGCSWQRLAGMNAAHEYDSPQDYWIYRVTQGQSFPFWQFMGQSIILSLLAAGLIFWVLLAFSECRFRRSREGGWP
jgi:hypothetical protein